MSTNMERSLREALSDPRRRAAVADALDWDDSQVSRFLSGQAGIVISKLDDAMGALGVVVVEPRYLDALATLSQVGASCACARQGLGACGGVR